ncbi:MAG: polyprenyl synthetase family protein [Pseudomonadota bacterium]
MLPNEALDLAITNALKSEDDVNEPPKLRDALHYALFPGGARVRPQLCLAVARAGGSKDLALAMNAAVALEFIHCASLVHDDLPMFDDADLRRGKPSIHKAFGEEIALLVGDTLIIKAFEVLANCASEQSARALFLIRCLARYSGSPNGICAGQAWESEKVIDLVQYHNAKTGALFVCATELGAIASGQDPSEWTELGARIGEAYQVADDLRDAVLSEVELGKPSKQDARHARPNSVQERGLQGSLQYLQNTLETAITSIPSCPGEADLCQLVRAQADRLTPAAAALPAAE